MLELESQNYKEETLSTIFENLMAEASMLCSSEV